MDSRFQNGRGERIRTSGLYVPNVALYQAKLHLAFLSNLICEFYAQIQAYFFLYFFCGFPGCILRDFPVFIKA